MNLIKLHALKLHLEKQLTLLTQEFATATADAEIFKHYKIDGYNNRVVELYQMYQKIREIRQHLWQVNQALEKIREDAKVKDILEQLRQINQDIESIGEDTEAGNILERMWKAPSTLEHPIKSEDLI